MSHLHCKHCDGKVSAEDEICPHCGIPLPPEHGREKQTIFRYWFIALLIFCLFMMFWLPPNWLQFGGK